MVFLRQYLLEDEENELKAWKSENSESENIPFLSVLHILHIYILSTFAFWNYEIAHHQLYFGKLQMHFLMMLNSPMPWMILQYILKFVNISHLIRCLLSMFIPLASFGVDDTFRWSWISTISKAFKVNLKCIWFWASASMSLSWLSSHVKKYKI